jgi:SulP family sulfate permease
VGISNTFIGLLGGFPMCHGAGGMAAHFQFGARTGGATIIIGSALIILAAVPGFSNALFLIPIPILATFLFLDGWRMVLLIRDLSLPVDYATAILVGGLAFFTGNLTLALVLGLINERILMRYYVK